MNGTTYDPRPSTPPQTPPSGVQTRREHVRYSAFFNTVLMSKNPRRLNRSLNFQTTV